MAEAINGLDWAQEMMKPAPEKILFLDIDGVLNSDKFSRNLTGTEIFPYGLELDPQALNYLKTFLEENIEVEIVISSSWRDTLTLEQFNELFADFGIHQRVIGLTSDEIDKPASIEKWIQTYNPLKYAILDDETLFDLNHRLHRYQVKTSMGIGLTPDHLAQVEFLL
jgi:hypothetical protein